MINSPYYDVKQNLVDKAEWIPDSDSDEVSSDGTESTISSYELNDSDSEDDSLIEELDQNSIHEWQWKTGHSHFSTLLNYFDGCSVGKNTTRPIDSFSKFICQDVIKLIIDQTNIYGRQRCIQKGGDATDWKDVDENQMYAFIGILFVMGFHKLPRMRDYWSQDRNLFTPVVANTMTRNDFQRIFSHLHLADNSKMHSKNSSNYNKLYKVNDFLYLLKRNFQRNYSLGSCVSIDEAMIKFKGRSSMKQYQPLKPTKRGYKVWVLAESTTGYVYNFEIYSWKEVERRLSLGEHVVMSLIEGISLKNRQLFFDSYFNSLVLLFKLRRQQIPATGTIRSDRKYFPTELKKREKLERGDYRYLTSNGVSVVKWMDKKEVFVASNYFDPTASGEVSRRGKDGSRRQISCPLAIVQYNKYMGGVDLPDQKIKCYMIDRKSKRNWIRIFLHFLSVSMMNSFVYYKQFSNSNIRTVEYVSSVSTALIGNYCSRKRLGRPLAMSNQKKMRIEKSMSDTENSETPQLLAHMPEIISTYRRCAYCSTKEREKRTNVMCTFCGVCLCVKNCFSLYHQNYVYQR